MHHRAVPVALMALVGLLAACAPPSPGTNASAAPGEPSAVGAASAPASPGGAPETSGAGGVVLPDGQWRSGDLHLDVSGAATMTIDLPLVQPGLTLDGATILTFAAADGSQIVTISSAEDQAAVAFTGPALLTGGSTVDTCRFSFSRADAESVEGTFRCTGLVAFEAGGIALGEIDVEGDFAAIR